MTYIPPRDAAGNIIAPAAGIKEPCDYRARLKGIANGTIPAGTAKNFDWQMQQLSWLGTNKVSYFDGVMYFASDAVMGDKVTFQAVDVEGLSYPAGTVLESFAEDWGVMPNIQDTIRLFKSKMQPGFYIRVKYLSTGATDVDFMCNLFRFIKTDEDA